MYTAGVTASAHAGPRSGQVKAVAGVLWVCCSRGASNLPAGDYFRPSIGPARLHIHSSARTATPGCSRAPPSARVWQAVSGRHGGRPLGHSPWHSRVTGKPIKESRGVTW